MGDISNWTSPIIGNPTKRTKLIKDADRADFIAKAQKLKKKKKKIKTPIPSAR